MPHLARRSSALQPLNPSSPNCARPSSRMDPRFTGNDEPCVSDLMKDPVLVRLRASDGVAEEELDRLVASMRERLGQDALKA